MASLLEEDEIVKRLPAWYPLVREIEREILEEETLERAAAKSSHPRRSV